MKLTVDRNRLTESVGLVAAIAEKSSGAIETTKYILLETTDGKLRLTGTDFQTVVVSYSPAIVESEGAVAVLAAKLQATLKAASSGDLTLEATKTHLIVGSEYGTTKIGAIEQENYPRPNLSGLKPAGKVNGAYLLRSIIETKAAVSENGQMVDGALWRIYENGVEIYATDGGRLIVSRSTKTNGTPVEFIVGPKAMGRIADLDSSEEWSVYVGDNMLMVADGSSEVYARRVEGKFPSVSAIMKPQGVCILVSREDLSRALRQASVGSGKNHSVEIIVDKETDLIVKAESDAAESQYDTPVEVIDGARETTRLNYAMLLGWLGVVRGEKIRAYINKDLPCMFFPDGQEAGTSPSLLVVMPMRGV